MNRRYSVAERFTVLINGVALGAENWLRRDEPRPEPREFMSKVAAMEAGDAAMALMPVGSYYEIITRYCVVDEEVSS